MDSCSFLNLVFLNVKGMHKKTAPEGGFGSDFLQEFLHQSVTRIEQQRFHQIVKIIIVHF